MAEVGALQTTLAAEHAAVYVLGALGAQTSASGSPGLFREISESYATHRGRRDFLTRSITDAGETPAVSEPAYELPIDLGTPDAVAARALALEQSCAETYAFLVASSTADLREWAVRALQMTAVRELAFRGTPEMFPGSDEYADR